MNNKLTSVLISLITLAIAIPSASANPTQTLAQVQGEDFQAFFGQGNQDIQPLEDGQPQNPSLEPEERNLEQDLNIQQNNPDAPEIEDIPSPALGDGDNVPTPPPLGEAEIKFPE